jgi:hypothetical protein
MDLKMADKFLGGGGHGCLWFECFANPHEMCGQAGTRGEKL